MPHLYGLTASGNLKPSFSTERIHRKPWQHWDRTIKSVDKRLERVSMPYMSKLLTAGSQVQTSWWFVYLKLYSHVNYIVVANSKATVLEKGSVFDLCVYFNVLLHGRYFNKIMEVVGFRAEKCFCYVKTWLFRFPFYHRSRLVGQRPFRALECWPHVLCPFLTEEYPSSWDTRQAGWSRTHF